MAQVAGVHVRQAAADPVQEAEELKRSLRVAVDPVAECRLCTAAYMRCLKLGCVTATLSSVDAHAAVSMAADCAGNLFIPSQVGAGGGFQYFHKCQERAK